MTHSSQLHPRRRFVGGNWKMNTDLASAVELADDVVAACAPLAPRCDIALFPPFPYLQAVGRTLGHHGLLLGAQDVYHERNGAFTGEVSTDMLLDLNVSIVLVGHSERRHVIGEDDRLINAKAIAAISAGLKIVLCIGETLAQRQAGQTDAVNARQLTSGLEGLAIGRMAHVTIAYEPVWAIGTGVVASAEDAQAAHKNIRRTLESLYDVRTAEATGIIYGGSLKSANAKELLAQPDVDGGLVGGASLKASEFGAIVRAAVEAPVHT